ncbi:hypothetical protein KSS87_001741 [Heliosperma pusillum]|nr:hypothetical protein KSS87_001741 [Heliosperma pusillum]
MSGIRVNLEDPIKDAVTRVRFAPQSNNLLISSWDSSIRLYDVEKNELRLEAQTEAAVLDCCFQNQSTAFSVASDVPHHNNHSKPLHSLFMTISSLQTQVNRHRRISLPTSQAPCDNLAANWDSTARWLDEPEPTNQYHKYDLQTGTCNDVGQHDDSATCIEYSDETGEVITTGWDRKMLSWDPRSFKVSRSLVGFTSHVESISLCRFELLVGTGSLVHKYDLRKLGGAIQAEELPMSISIRCVRAVTGWEGFAVGSVDGRVTLQTNSSEMG